MNQLYFGDCLDVLRQLDQKHPEPFIDLIYIDPPFNSKRNYNVLFEALDQKDANAQKQAFADTWSNVAYMDELHELAALNKDLYDVLRVLMNAKSVSDSAVAYLTTMAHRVYYMHRLLKPTGSFYLHCDPTMSHYLKLMCDIIFGDRNYRNEITWKRSSAHSDGKQGRKAYGNISDTIFFYTKTDQATFNTIYTEYSQEYVKGFYSYVDEAGRRFRLDNLTAAKGGGDTSYDFHGTKPYKGRYWAYSKENMEKFKAEGRLYFPKNGGTPSYKRYLDEMPGVSLQNIWDDIKPVQSEPERLGYPTQKPIALLERIIQASSNEGDVVTDFFCGCGTTIAAAQKLNRRWLGSDISHLAVRLILKRLEDSFGHEARKNVELHGFPRDIGSARMLAQETKDGRFTFQDWAIEVLLGGVVNPKKVADGGYDGYMTFEVPDTVPGRTRKEFVLIETKSGNVQVKNIREFVQVVRGQNAAIGVFVCFADTVTAPMEKEAREAGYYDEERWGTRYPRIQIITVEDLLNNHRRAEFPASVSQTFKTAQKETAKPKGNQLGLDFGG